MVAGLVAVALLVSLVVFDGGEKSWRKPTQVEVKAAQLVDIPLGGSAPCVAKTQALIDAGWVTEPYYAVYGYAVLPDGKKEGHVWLVVDGKIVDPALNDVLRYEPMQSDRNPKTIRTQFSGGKILHKDATITR